MLHGLVISAVMKNQIENTSTVMNSWIEMSIKIEHQLPIHFMWLKQLIPNSILADKILTIETLEDANYKIQRIELKETYKC